MLAFTISALIHHGSDMAIGIPRSEAGQFAFFFSQAGAIIFEEIVQSVYRLLSQKAADTSLLPRTVTLALGYIWVILWFLWITPGWSYATIRYVGPFLPSAFAPSVRRWVGL